jgi:hypothetical protein
MAAMWTVKDANGELLAHFMGASLLEVARKVVPVRYDAFRLHVSTSYRELFERALKQILQREDWRIVPLKGTRTARSTETVRSGCVVQSDEFATDCSVACR